MTDFLSRALHEAARYGADPWIFVRELLQNARDAGASTVWFVSDERDGVARLHCRDDGEGMSFEHAQRYLFRLYSSSKEGQGGGGGQGDAGRFGVGFWSILRYQPARIYIRSWPRSGEPPWEIVLDGKLGHALRRALPRADRSGTEIILERPNPDGQLSKHVRDAAWQNARFLQRKDAPGVPLQIQVDGQPINEPFELPAPSIAFRSGRARGVVALGKTARVELMSKGLRVRSAVMLEELLTSGAEGQKGAGSPDLLEGLSPQALLESDELQLLLSRTDAREDRALKKLVRQAQRELARLIEQQLSLARPQPLWRQIFDWSRHNFIGGIVTSLVLMTPVALGIHRVMDDWGWHGDGGSAPAALAVPSAAPSAPAVEEESSPSTYRDPGRYSGPRVNVIAEDAQPLPLRYSPEGATPYLASLRVSSLDDAGRPTLGGTRALVPYEGAPCEQRCLTVELPVRDGPGPLRLPVPSGHRVDVESVSLDGTPRRVYASSGDEPFLMLKERTRGILRYRTAPGPTRISEPIQGRELPASIAKWVAELRALPRSEAARRAVEHVRSAIAYSTAAEVEASWRAAASAGGTFLERSLRVGAGDCDIQNGVLLIVLQEAGIPAQLALGYVGRQGQVLPWQHAWIEYADEHGALGVLDASLGSTAAPRPPAPLAPVASVAGLAGEATPERIPAAAAVVPARGGTPISDVKPALDAQPEPAVADAKPESAPAPEPKPASAAKPEPPDEAKPEIARAEKPEPKPEPLAEAKPEPSAEPSPPPETAAPASPPADPSDRAAAREPEAAREPNAWLVWIGELAARRFSSFDPVAVGVVINVAIAVMLLLLLDRLVRWLGRSRGAELKLDAGVDLSKLLLGALVHPDAFADVPSLHHRRLVPCVGGGAASLIEIRRAAAKGRLYSSQAQPRLALQVARQRGLVLDRSTREGAGVARALGAVDLDAWSQLFANRQRLPVLDRVNLRLGRGRAGWWVFAAPDAPLDVSVLDLPKQRYVCVKASEPWLVAAAQAFAQQPRRSVFDVVDRLADRLRLSYRRRARLLAPLATDAVREAGNP